MKITESSECKKARKDMEVLFSDRMSHDAQEAAKTSAMAHMVDDSTTKRKVLCPSCWDEYMKAERRYHASM
jgi:hypothetical protein